MARSGFCSIFHLRNTSGPLSSWCLGGGNVILRRLADAIKKQDWFLVLLEVMIVVVGIFIGLQVDDWNQQRLDRVNESIYLEELLEDFEANRAQLTGSIGQLEGILKAMTTLLVESAKDSPTLTATQLNDAFRNIHSMPTFIAVTRTYANLTGSGDLVLLRNRALKNEVAKYFAAADLAFLVQSTHEMELVQTFQPYVIENMDFQAVYHDRVDDFPIPPAVEHDRILGVLGTREFRNILTQKHTICTDLINQHRNLLFLTDVVIGMLRVDIGDIAQDRQ